MKVDKVTIYRVKIPLNKPYQIATARIEEYDLTLAVIRAGDREGLGEAMANVQGYFWETPDQVWDFARQKGKEILGQSLSRAREIIRGSVKDQPCAATPFLTALEMAGGSPLLAAPPASLAVPLVAILQAGDREGIEREVSQFLAAGYATVKVKVGFDAEGDAERVGLAQQALGGRATIRVDANQGFSLPEAKRFVNRIDPQGIEFLEQPFKEDEWGAMAELAKVSPIPLGLDESIYGMESVRKALRLECARFVKFKLMKIGSAEALREHIEQSRDWGLEIILGNGAAGEISCFHEALVAGSLLTRAGEMNGFLKQKESILVRGLRREGASLVVGPADSPRLDPRKLDRYCLKRLAWE